MKAYLGCDIGKKRTENQDSIRAEHFPDGVLAIVCDGMGGMLDGAIASKIAIEEAESTFCAGHQSGMSTEAICELLRIATADANRKVYQASMRGRMGTTLVGTFVRKDCACIVHVGDSRAYLIDGAGNMRQITTDHTVVQLYFEQGMITAAERATHPRRNELMRAVGVSSRVLADTHVLNLQEGDRILLCSDGLYGMVSDAEMAEIVQQNPPEQVPDLCVEAANEHGGKDNISVILITA